MKPRLYIAGSIRPGQRLAGWLTNASASLAETVMARDASYQALQSIVYTSANTITRNAVYTALAVYVLAVVCAVKKHHSLTLNNFILLHRPFKSFFRYII